MDTTSRHPAAATKTTAEIGAAMVMQTSALQPDLVDLIFAYVIAEFPEIAARAAVLKDATRKEFGGIETYIAQRSPIARQKTVNDVLHLFNGRNASEIARRLNISRATVYRLIKTSGKPA